MRWEPSGWKLATMIDDRGVGGVGKEVRRLQRFGRSNELTCPAKSPVPESKRSEGWAWSEKLNTGAVVEKRRA
jgi:hypothetical protein